MNRHFIGTVDSPKAWTSLTRYWHGDTIRIRRRLWSVLVSGVSGTKRPTPSGSEFICGSVVLGPHRRRPNPLLAQRDRKIRELREAEFTLQQIGARFFMTPSGVSRVLSRRARKEAA